jgi:magnesium chelatase family protein
LSSLFLAVARYLARISGPLLDRIDLQVEVQSPTYEEISSSFEHVSSIEESISVRISQARERQQFRLRGYPGLYTNAMMNHGITRKTCKTGSQAEALMAMLYRSDRISARMYDRILRVSRTIADLDDSNKIKEEHVAEAIQYRSIERRVHGVM